MFRFDKAKRILAAKLCFFVFFTKMLISASPMFIDILDKGTILQVVMQLELELTAKGNNTTNEDLHEGNVKVFKPDSIDYISYNPTVENDNKQRNYLKDERLICHYQPSVPTPPPNC